MFCFVFETVYSVTLGITIIQHRQIPVPRVCVIKRLLEQAAHDRAHYYVAGLLQVVVLPKRETRSANMS